MADFAKKCSKETREKVGKVINDFHNQQQTLKMIDDTLNCARFVDKVVETHIEPYYNPLTKETSNQTITKFNKDTLQKLSNVISMKKGGDPVVCKE